jgi:glycosyltransferase involved in cell wall biosynthesis
MRIVIDLQGAQSASSFRGIGRYSLSLALAMARNAGEHEIWLALNGAFPESILTICHAFEGIIPSERIRIFDIPAPVAEIDTSNEWRIRAAEKIREHFLQQLKPDIVHVSSLFEGFVDDAVTSVGTVTSGLFTAITIYDLIPLLNQKDYLINETQRAYYLRKIESLKNAGLLLTISEASRHEAIDVLKLPPNKIVNISAAADEKFHPITLTMEHTNQLRSHFGIRHNMVMYAPGGFDTRKNFEGLISAYSMLSLKLRANHQLVIVGNTSVDQVDYLQCLAKQAGLAKDDLIITGYISDDDLIDLYNMTTLFVFPSKHEGFGLPMLEAMACGAPVIGSNTTSIPEVINFPEALFDPLSPQDFAKKMTHALCDKSFRDRLSIHGLKQARNFSWDVCAKRTLNAFEIMTKERASITSNETLDITHELIRSIAEICDVRKPKDADLVRVAECIAFNAGRAATKQLLLDISLISQSDAKTGIQRVVRSLLRELIEKPPINTDVRAIYFDGTNYKYANTFTANFSYDLRQTETDEIVDFCQDDTYLAIDLNAPLSTAVHHIHKHLKCHGIKLYFIVYDILLVQHPEWWPAGTSAMFEVWLRNIAEVSTGLICISEAVAEEVREWLKQNLPRRISDPMVKSFHLGADVENSLPSKGMPYNANTTLTTLKTGLSFLIVGTVEPRKGHTQTLAAFELLWAQGVNANLVIVGKRGWLVDELVSRLEHHSELNKRLFWLEGISDEYLESVYAACSCLISPSEGEGFGLPLIEAAQHQKPIIARDISVFREVAGDHAYYFKGKNPEDLAVPIIEWIAFNNAGCAPDIMDMSWLTWAESAEQLKSILNEKSTTPEKE